MALLDGPPVARGLAEDFIERHGGVGGPGCGDGGRYQVEESGQVPLSGGLRSRPASATTLS